MISKVRFLHAVGAILLIATMIMDASTSSADVQIRFKIPGVKATGATAGEGATPLDEPTEFNPCGDFRIEGENTCVFTFTGVTESFVVPPDRSEVGIKAWAAGGGGSANRAGGGGGFAEASVPASPDAVLFVNVGGGGYAGPYNATNGRRLGGHNGGGNGGMYMAAAVGGSFAYEGAGGGGGSDIRTSASLDDRIVVAGGGGGAGEASSSVTGGELLGFGRGGGGEEGNSEPTPCCDGSGVAGGPGGTQTNGGDDGIVIFMETYGNWTGEAGSFGQGGQDDYTHYNYGFWGGGGGGWWGGAAGNVYSGGGGGSGHVPTGGSMQSGSDGTDLGGGAVGNAAEAESYAAAAGHVDAIGQGGGISMKGVDGLVVITW